MISSFEALGRLKTLACSRNSASVLIFVSATPLSLWGGSIKYVCMYVNCMELRGRVASKNCVYKQNMLGLGLGLTTYLHTFNWAWWQSRTGRSVSSPTSTVVTDRADCIAVWTISRSASPSAWIVVHPDSSICAVGKPSTYARSCFLSQSEGILSDTAMERCTIRARRLGLEVGGWKTTSNTHGPAASGWIPLGGCKVKTI